MIAAVCARKSTRQSLAIALTLVALGQAPASATIVVGYRTQTQFLIAADGLRGTKGWSATGQLPAPSEFCKIFSVAQAIFGIAGWSPRTFNLIGDVSGILANRTTIQAAEEQMVKLLTPKVNSWLAQRGPVYVRQVIGNVDDLVIQLVFGAFEESAPSVRLLAFRLVSIDPPRADPVTKWSCSGTTPCVQNLVFLVGKDSLAEKLVHDAAKRAATEADFVASLVQMDIDAGMPDIGPPIAVAELTSTGVSWPRIGACGGGIVLPTTKRPNQ